MYPKLLLQRELSNQIFCSYAHDSVSTPFHFHSNIELYLVEEGEVDVWVNRKYKRLHGGQFSLALGYDSHRYETVGNAKVTCLIIPSFMSEELNEKKLYEPFITNPELFDGIKQCCRVISQRTNHLLTNGCVNVILGLLLENIDFSERHSNVSSDGMSAVLVYLHDNFKNDTALSTVAKEFGFNASYLSRQFKETFGIGLGQYVTMLRLREAVKLLRLGVPISHCAYESGFQSVRTFYRAFEKEFNCTPNKYIQSGK